MERVETTTSLLTKCAPPSRPWHVTNAASLVVDTAVQQIYASTSAGGLSAQSVDRQLRAGFQLECVRVDGIKQHDRARKLASNRAAMAEVSVRG